MGRSETVERLAGLAMRCGTSHEELMRSPCAMLAGVTLELLSSLRWPVATTRSSRLAEVDWSR